MSDSDDHLLRVLRWASITFLTIGAALFAADFIAPGLVPNALATTALIVAILCGAGAYGVTLKSRR